MVDHGSSWLNMVKYGLGYVLLNGSMVLTTIRFRLGPCFGQNMLLTSYLCHTGQIQCVIIIQTAIGQK